MVICHTWRRGNKPSWHCRYTVKIFSKAENEQWVFPSHPSPLPLCITQHVVKSKQTECSVWKRADWAHCKLPGVLETAASWHTGNGDRTIKHHTAWKKNDSFADFPQVLCAHGWGCVKPQLPSLFKHLGHWDPSTWQPWHGVIMWSCHIGQPLHSLQKVGGVQKSCISSMHFIKCFIRFMSIQ